MTKYLTPNTQQRIRTLAEKLQPYAKWQHTPDHSEMRDVWNLASWYRKRTIREIKENNPTEEIFRIHVYDEKYGEAIWAGFKAERDMSLDQIMAVLLLNNRYATRQQIKEALLTIK